MSRSTLPRPHDAGLSHRQVADLRALLEEQRDFRIEQLSALLRPGQRGLLDSADPEIYDSLVSGARAALQDVQGALWRIDQGRYGLCVACGGAVELHRLETLPQTAKCAACQRQPT